MEHGNMKTARQIGTPKVATNTVWKDVRSMGNVYKYSECDHCHKLTDADYTFIVHGSRALTKLDELKKAGFPVGKIAAQYCGYCGGYVELSEEECACGNFRYQGWNYQEDDPRQWE